MARWLGRAPDEITDLSASLNPLAPDVGPILRAHEGTVHRYPDATAATSALAQAIGVEAERLVLTNGGSEAIALVASIEPVGWVEQPEFSLYARHLTHLDPDGPRWRSNPGNPGGRLAPADASAAVWDEAFWQLATGTWTRGDVSWRVGSLTKLWACPGLRIGYAIAPDDKQAATLRSLQPQWSVNALALTVVEELVDRSDLTVWAADIVQRRAALAALLRQYELTVHDTDACWVLVEHAGLRDELAPHGVVVRDCTSFALPGTFRVAVPDDRGFDALAHALQEVFG